MMSPDRIAMMERRMNELAEISRRLEEQEEQDREWLMRSEARAHETRIRESESRILESEARIQASDNRIKASDAQLSEINAWMRMHTERVRVSTGGFLYAIIATLTEMQADIARIDAES